jgi:thiol-disulfide isomerase/thioredoxin
MGGETMAMRKGFDRLSMLKLMTGFGAALAIGFIRVQTACAGSDLKLAPDLSFIDDSSANFPIQAADPGDGTISTDQPTVVFFGTSHCWNTNREAERVVKLYPRYRGQVHFVIVDLNNVSPAQRPLVANYYGGYIPTVVIFDRTGKVVYDRAGETAGPRLETHNLAALINEAVNNSAPGESPQKSSVK